MSTNTAAMAILAVMVSACGAGAPDRGGLGASGGTVGSSAGGTTGTPGAALSMLSLAEAPAATRTFYWGTLAVTAPGFVGPPRDEMTIGLGPDNGLRYLSWKTLPVLPKTFGDSAHDFPLVGSRAVDLSPDITTDYSATVLEGPAPTATHFLLREHVVSVEGQCDYIESTEGTKTDDGWLVAYSEKGKLWGADISAQGQGVLYAGDPDAVVAAAGQPSLWSAPIELAAPGFYGPPVDHLTVALDGNGQLRWFMFQDFVRGASFTGSKEDVSWKVNPIEAEGEISFDSVVPATSEHFVIRYHARSDTKLNDFTEGLDGTRQGDKLVIRYFISGKLWGATIAGHAAGTLVPATASVIDEPMGSGGTSGSGGGGAGGLSMLP